MLTADTAIPYDKLATLVEILRWRALHQPEQNAYTFLVDGENEEKNITYAQLDQQATTIAALLQQRMAVGERVLLLYPPGLEYIAAFMGCLYAGIIAVPAYPPSSNRSLGRILSIAENAGAKAALSVEQIFSKVQQWSKDVPELMALQWIATDTQPETSTAAWRVYHPELQSLAFLQYTSGSTGVPKGVMVSHQNLIHNLAAIRRSGNFTPQSIGVSWLPMFHDMGLILGILQSLYTGYLTIVMAPAAFIQQPLRWLTAITKYRATASYAPNFAYDLCCDHIPEAARAYLDLRSWKVATNGAEPIPAETLSRFHKTYAQYGLSQTAMTPVYGLAEGTLLVSNPAIQNVPTVLFTDRVALEQHRVVPSPIELTETKLVVGCGYSIEDQQIRIVHPETLSRCQSNEVGEIWVKGASVSQGYWQRPKETTRTFQAYLADNGEGPFLRTGDLGFLYKDELFITGRLKDIIIIRGRNYYPQDIEHTVELSHNSLRPGCGAAFSLTVAGEERLVVVQELQRHYADTAPIISTIRQAIAEQYEIQVYAVVLIRYSSILKTTSGKIQRRACREAFLNHELRVVASDILDTDASISNKQPDEPPTFLSQFPTLTLEQKRANILQYVTNRARLLLDLAPDAHLPLQENLLGLGIDSLKAGQLINAMKTGLGISLPSTLIFTMEEPTIENLSEYLLNEMCTISDSPTAHPILTYETLNAWLDDIAILAEDEVEMRLHQQLTSISEHKLIRSEYAYQEYRKEKSEQ